MVSSSYGDLGLLLSMVVIEEVSGRQGHAEDGLSFHSHQQTHDDRGVLHGLLWSSSSLIRAVSTGGESRERPAKPWGLVLLQQAPQQWPGDPWLGYKVQAGILAKAHLACSREGQEHLKTRSGCHWEGVQGA